MKKILVLATVLAVLLLTSSMGSAVKINAEDADNSKSMMPDGYSWIWESLGPIGKIMYIFFTYLNLWCATAKLAAIFAILTGQT